MKQIHFKGTSTIRWICGILIRRRIIIGEILFLGIVLKIISSSSSPPQPHQVETKTRDDFSPLRRDSKPQLFHLLDLHNEIGFGQPTTSDLISRLLNSSPMESELKDQIWKMTLQSRQILDHKFIQTPAIQNGAESIQNVLSDWRRNSKWTIHVATVVCDEEEIQRNVKILIKSAVLFSRDSLLHFIIFGDQRILQLAQWLLELKWTVNGKGWDFAYEFRYLDFPKEKEKMWDYFVRPCPSQLLFLPSLLKDYNEVIYLDPHSIVLSNLTLLWLEQFNVDPIQIVSMGPHMNSPARGIYQLIENIPFYGDTGLDAGLMLMNLRRMRNVHFEEKVEATFMLYRDRLTLHSQDVLNILFHTYPEFVKLLSCSFTFNEMYCGVRDGQNDKKCIFEIEEGPKCFCFPSLHEGVRIAYSNPKLFIHKNESFISRFGDLILNFDLGQNSFRQLIQDLQKSFNSFNRPCFDLTADQMLLNTQFYFEHFPEY